MPTELSKHNVDNWYEEEKNFIFYLDAYWGNKTHDYQLIQILSREIDDLIKKKPEDTLPEGVDSSIRKSLKNSTSEEEKNRIRSILRQGAVKQKRMEIDKIMDDVKDLLTSDAFSKYSQDVYKKLNG